MLNQTIPGGATKDAAGTWRDANGNELPKNKVAEVERIQAEAQRAHDAQEAQRQQQALLINPAFAGAVQAIGMLRGQPQATEPAEDPKAPKQDKA